MSFYNGVLNFNDSSGKGERGERGFPGVGFKLDGDGNYDMESKRLVNVKNGANPNDVATKGQIQVLDNTPGNVQNNKAVIYSGTGSVHTNSVYLQDTPDGAGSFNSVRLLTQHQSYENIHLHVPDLQNFDGNGGRKKSEIVVTSTEQNVTGKKVFSNIEVPNPTNNNQAANKKYVDDEVKKIPSSDLSPYLKKDGTVVMTGNLDLGNQQITNLGFNIQNSADVVNLGFCDTKYLQKVSDSDLDMDSHRIKDMAQPINNNDATTKAYVDSEIAKIPSPDLSTYVKKDGSVAMTGNLDMNNQYIQNIKTPKANESDKSANVGFVVKEINDSNANLTQQYKDYMAQSHLISKR